MSNSPTIPVPDTVNRMSLRVLAAPRLLCAAALVSAALLAAAQEQKPVPPSPSAPPLPTAPAPPPSNDPAVLQAQIARMEKTLKDWPNIERYRRENALLPVSSTGDRVVFMGDSITDAWGRTRGKDTFFLGKNYINRGISGQTTPQMLIRFRPDVINLKPRVVVILAGTNDIAGNTGPMMIEDIEGNLTSMAQLAAANNIKVVLASVLPTCDYIKVQSDRRPNQKIIALNAWIKEYATLQSHIYLDYFSAMLDDKGELKKELTYDGLHPNDEGYAVMQPLAAKAIEAALSGK